MIEKKNKKHSFINKTDSEVYYDIFVKIKFRSYIIVASWLHKTGSILNKDIM